MQPEVQISIEVKSVESDGDVIVISEKFLRVKRISLAGPRNQQRN